jgi:hypothetical protein
LESKCGKMSRGFVNVKKGKNNKKKRDNKSRLICV